jgi:hypothetical protein
MAKIDSASQGKKVSEKKSEKVAAPHVVLPRTNNGETATAPESSGKKNVCSCCAPVRDDTAVAVSLDDKDYLDAQVAVREKLTGKKFSVKEQLHEILTAYRAIGGPGVKA